MREPLTTQQLTERAIARMVEESGLPERLVRPMVEMEAARCPESLLFLAAVAHNV